MMRKLLIALAATTALASGAMINGLPATAAPGTQGIAIDNSGLVQNAAYVFGGHKHCWYNRGWKGSGWYWCGYSNRKGRGWGGEEGWNGWHH